MAPFINWLFYKSSYKKSFQNCPNFEAFWPRPFLSARELKSHKERLRETRGKGPQNLNPEAPFLVPFYPFLGPTSDHFLKIGNFPIFGGPEKSQNRMDLFCDFSVAPVKISNFYFRKMALFRAIFTKSGLPVKKESRKCTHF